MVASGYASMIGECVAITNCREVEIEAAALRVQPQATAIASRSIDLPDPFSPTGKVTCGWKGSVSRPRRAGSAKGYPRTNCPPGCSAIQSSTTRRAMTRPERSSLVSMTPLNVSSITAFRT